MTKSRNIISALLITVMAATVFCIPMFNSEVDAAAKKVKVTYNANKGKFTDKTYKAKKSYSKKIKKGKKLGKLPKIKRDGYTLKGWYTKKTGGKKVTTKTKIKKKTTLYAQWKKKATKNDPAIEGYGYLTQPMYNQIYANQSTTSFEMVKTMTSGVPYYKKEAQSFIEYGTEDKVLDTQWYTSSVKNPKQNVHIIFNLTKGNIYRIDNSLSW